MPMMSQVVKWEKLMLYRGHILKQTATLNWLLHLIISGVDVLQQPLLIVNYILYHYYTLFDHFLLLLLLTTNGVRTLNFPLVQVIAPNTSSRVENALK